MASASAGTSLTETSRAAYVFGLVGDNCTPHLQASLLSAIDTLVNARPLFPIVSMLGPVCAAKGSLRVHLQHLMVRAVEVAELRDIPCRGSKTQGARLAPTYTMSAVWSLTMFDVVLLLDSDLAVVRPMDDVLEFMLRNPSYIEARTPLKCRTPISTSLGDDALFNSGVWALRPSRTVHATFVDWMQGNRDGSRFPCGIGIQDAANAFFVRTKVGKQRSRESRILGLSVANNLKVDTRTRRCLKTQNISDSQVRVVHWSGPRKPQRIRANDLDREPRSVRIGLLTYASAYCRFLQQLNASIANGTEACQKSRWKRFAHVAAQSNLSMWASKLSLDVMHPIHRCANAGARFAACLRVPAMSAE